MEKKKRNLYHERRKRGLTLQNVAKEIGITDSQLSRLENCNRGVSAKSGFKLSEFFNKDIEYLLTVPARDEVLK